VLATNKALAERIEQITGTVKDHAALLSRTFNSARRRCCAQSRPRSYLATRGTSS
jgi:hypothetical protein